MAGESGSTPYTSSTGEVRSELDGEEIKFPGGGTHFHYGADIYIVAIAGMLKFPDCELNNGGHIRTVLDMGCGVASFGAYLFRYNIIAMSLAPNDAHGNQIRFALERGIPATLGVLGTRRMPYPSRSFELAHCSAVGLIGFNEMVFFCWNWTDYLDQEAILYTLHPKLMRVMWKINEFGASCMTFLRRMCWRVVAKKDQTVIWAKPLSNSCYRKQTPGILPLMCVVLMMIQTHRGMCL